MWKKPELKLDRSVLERLQLFIKANKILENRARDYFKDSLEYAVNKLGYASRHHVHPMDSDVQKSVIALIQHPYSHLSVSATFTGAKAAYDDEIWHWDTCLPSLLAGLIKMINMCQPAVIHKGKMMKREIKRQQAWAELAVVVKIIEDMKDSE